VGTTCATEPDDTFDYNNIEKYCYDNNEANCDVYGGLYSWSETLGLPNKCKAGVYSNNGDFSVYTHATDSDCDFSVPRQGICPSGWHIPSYIHGQPGYENYNDWRYLQDYLAVDGQGGAGTAVGGKLKESGLAHWATPNLDGTNSSGFTALGAGIRHNNSYYYGLTTFSYLFATLPPSDGYGWRFTLGNDINYVGGGTYWGERNNAFAVRCLKDF
jgi:uncharacterized protein (TIGR02145 family)